MRYEEFPAPDDIRQYVACFWLFELGPNAPERIEHTIVPDGTASLCCIVIAGRTPLARFSGPSAKALRVEVWRGVQVWGIRLKPGVLPALLHVRADALAGRTGSLAEIAPELAESVVRCAEGGQQSILDRFTAEVRLLAAGAAPPDAVVQRTVDRLIKTDGDEAIGTLARECGISPRQLQRRFRAATGLSPREFARLRRMRRACMEVVMGNANWAAAAAESGYADQSHMIREFRYTFGWPPGVVGEYLGLIEHRVAR